MNDEPSPTERGSTRRQMIAGSLMALGSLAAAARVAGQAQPPAPPPAAVPDSLRTSIHQEVDFGVAPKSVYEALLDSSQFSAITGLSAVISRDEGGAFTMFGGIIVGRNIELVPDKRVVQAWRPAYWKPGVYSLVKFELLAAGDGTTVVLDHTGFHEGLYASLSSGWGERYWEPMRKYFSPAPAGPAKGP
jgi:activator of HSP90 ATPase